jgi:hypothetical protein
MTPMRSALRLRSHLPRCRKPPRTSSSACTRGTKVRVGAGAQASIVVVIVLVGTHVVATDLSTSCREALKSQLSELKNEVTSVAVSPACEAEAQTLCDATIDDPPAPASRRLDELVACNSRIHLPSRTAAFCRPSSGPAAPRWFSDEVFTCLSSHYNELSEVCQNRINDRRSRQSAIPDTFIGQTLRASRCR